MADQPIQRNVPRPVESVPSSRPADSGGTVPRPAVEQGNRPASKPTEPDYSSRQSAPTSDPDTGSRQPMEDKREDQEVSRPIAENSEHTLEQAMADTPEVVRCQCDNARCTGHYRKSYCFGTATHGAVRSNRPDDPMMVMCETCFNHTMEFASEYWTAVDGAMDRYHEAQDMHVDPNEESRRASRIHESERAAREEGVPATSATPDQRSVESVKAAQTPQRDHTVPVLQDSYQTTSQIPVLDPPEKE